MRWPARGRGYPPDLVSAALVEISERVGRPEARCGDLEVERGLLNQVLAQRNWELDRQRYAAGTTRAARGGAGDRACVRTGARS